MRKRTLIIVGAILAALLAGVPVWAFAERADPQGSERAVPDELMEGKELFQVNCGSCHTLYAAGTLGNFGPDLDERLAPSGPVDEDGVDSVRQLVLSAIENGVPPVNMDQPEEQPPTRMPAGILAGDQAEEVAEFVARVAGQG